MPRNEDRLRIAPRLTLLKLGVDITVDVSDEDGVVVVFIDTPEEHELTGPDESGQPKLRVYLNDGEIYENE